MGERVAKAILELHWPHPALLSTIHKSRVLLNDPDHRYPGSRKTTYTLYVNTTSVVTNTLEDGGYYWEGFILGIQTPASAQQQIQRSLCCPPSPDRRHTGGGPWGAPHCAAPGGYLRQPWQCPRKPQSHMYERIDLQINSSLCYLSLLDKSAAPQAEISSRAWQDPSCAVPPCAGSLSQPLPPSTRSTSPTS